MKFLITVISVLILNAQAFADVDVVCGCKGPVVYGGQGQVAGSGKNVPEAMESAEYQCSRFRGGDRLDACQVKEAKSNPSVLCDCKVGLFNKGQVTGAGRNLSEAFEGAIGQCESRGLSSGAMNGLLGCQVY